MPAYCLNAELKFLPLRAPDCSSHPRGDRQHVPRVHVSSAMDEQASAYVFSVCPIMFHEYSSHTCSWHLSVAVMLVAHNS